MCGLVGAYGDLRQDQLTYVKQALIADYFRGKHSTGICSTTEENVFTKKLCLDPINFLQLKDVDDNIKQTKLAIMGHNRHATVGNSGNPANAHPFTHGSITLMHNGTLTNKRQLELDFDAPDFGTDSELVCWLIDKYKLDGVIESLQGAFALVWWDTDDNTLNFIRNEERPLSFAFNDDTMMWASELPMMQWLHNRTNVFGVPLFTKGDYEYKESEVGKHYQISLNDKKFLEIKEEELKLAPKPVKRNYSTVNGGNSTRYCSAENAFKEKYGSSPKIGDEIICFVDAVDQFHNRHDITNVEGTMFTYPNATVKAYSISHIKKQTLQATILIKGKVSGFSNYPEPAVILYGNTIQAIDGAEADNILDNYSDVQTGKEITPL